MKDRILELAGLTEEVIRFSGNRSDMFKYIDVENPSSLPEIKKYIAALEILKFNWDFVGNGQRGQWQTANGDPLIFSHLPLRLIGNKFYASLDGSEPEIVKLKRNIDSPLQIVLYSR